MRGLAGLAAGPVLPAGTRPCPGSSPACPCAAGRGSVGRNDLRGEAAVIEPALGRPREGLWKAGLGGDYLL